MIQFNRSYPSKQIKELFEAILKLKTINESAKFFRDLLTIAELEEFANRWQVVKLLHKKESYAKIAERLHISTATVTRVAHWYKHGMGGYQIISERIFGKSSKK